MREKTQKFGNKREKHANQNFRDAPCLNKKRAVFYSAKSRKNAPQMQLTNLKTYCDMVYFGNRTKLACQLFTIRHIIILNKQVASGRNPNKCANSYMCSQICVVLSGCQAFKSIYLDAFLALGNLGDA
ncbi:Hypothetical_protein [Hexamita inflata]|uniref:Hypothetical_protein n=1 Tax=Hexamita inflata TaxID=28002 RepID=A0AA86UIG6_9EUKA|nr:Hypothetical protein HINF_LOCUS44759 [Hexamita inflata]